MQDHPACLVAELAKDNCGHTSLTDELYHVRFICNPADADVPCIGRTAQFLLACDSEEVPPARYHMYPSTMSAVSTNIEARVRLARVRGGHGCCL